MECHSCQINKIVQAFVEADLDRSMGRCQSKAIKEACKRLQEAMQNVCLACVGEVNDNNPSNHGQTFYSLDSGHCQSNSGKSKTSHSDDNEVISRADWINSNASYDSAYYSDHQFRPYSGESPIDPAIAAMKSSAEMRENSEKASGGLSAASQPQETSQQDSQRDKRFFEDDVGSKEENPFLDEFSITNLPSEVEAIVLKEINTFAGLPIQAKMLICCLLEGKNLSDFSRLTWLPKGWLSKEARQKSPISPQMAHALFLNICRKLPHFAVLARATKKRSKERIDTQNKAIKDYQAKTAARLDYLRSPATLHRKPKENPIARAMEDMREDDSSEGRASRASKKNKSAESMEFDF